MTSRSDLAAKDCIQLIVRAENLPKMDTIGRIDPYFRIDYCGKKIYSSPVIKECATPVWPRIVMASNVGLTFDY